MDTSKEYIKQCEKAAKIQGEWNPQVADVYSTGFNILTIEHVMWYESLKEIVKGRHSQQLKSDIIWLPRQDQLQEMLVKRIWDWRGVLSRFTHSFCQHTDTHKFDSMEQLWLAFVMKEKYSKTWNGEDWV